MDTRPRIGGLICGSAAKAPLAGGTDSIAQTASRRARRAMTIDASKYRFNARRAGPCRGGITIHLSD
jgi:hypothetical protein